MRPFLLACTGLALVAATARAERPADFQEAFASEAQRSSPGFAGFSPQRGAELFRTAGAGDWSCATCHGDDPRSGGQHAVTGKAIEPLAPSANPSRFTRAETVEKWFRRNCNDVLERPCTAKEKGDLLAWLMSLGG